MAITAKDVLLFYPNLVGYGRVLFMLISFGLSTTSWKLCMIFYFLAFVGDVVDGHVARKFDQCSAFGGILDMVTDRVSTCGLLMIVSVLYPKYALWIIALVILDIGSHWFHVMSVKEHHKSAEALIHRNPLLKWYYSIYPLFGYCCVGTELFYIMLYIDAHDHGIPHLQTFMWVVCFPACFLKQMVNFVQLSSAAYAIAERDALEIKSTKKL